jgi:hypothetical protein
MTVFWFETDPTALDLTAEDLIFMDPAPQNPNFIDAEEEGLFDQLLTVKVFFIDQTQGWIFLNVKNTFTEGGLYCIERDDYPLKKYPLCRIDNIEEEQQQ